MVQLKKYFLFKESLRKTLYHEFCSENNDIVGTEKTSYFVSFLEIGAAMAHNFCHGDLLRSSFKPWSKKFGINIWEALQIQRYKSTAGQDTC